MRLIGSFGAGTDWLRLPSSLAEVRPKPSVKGCAPSRAPEGREVEIPLGGDQKGNLGGSGWIRLAGKDEHVAAEAGEWGWA